MTRGLMTYRLPNGLGLFSGLRIFDTVLTILVLWLLFWLLQWKVGNVRPLAALWQSLVLALLLTFPLAIFFHAIFQVPTTLTCRLGLISPDRCDVLMRKIAAEV